MPALVRQNIIAKARRIVVKVGTNALCDANGRLDPAIVSQLAQQIADDTGVQLIALYTGSLGEPGSGAETYVELIRYDVRRIVEALR